jgi:outer membrane protein TolC
MLACLAGLAVAPVSAQEGPAPGSSAPGGALSLPDALKEALSKSEEAQILLEKEKHVAAQKREVWATALPIINVTADVGRGNTVMDPSMFGAFGGGADTSAGGGGPAFPDGAFSFEQNRYAYAIDAYQPLFAFGRVMQAVRAADYQERAEADDRTNSRYLLQMQVLDTYYRYVTARAYVGTLEASIKRHSETVSFLESNFRMGAGVRSNVLRAITTLKSLEPQRIRAERDAEASRMELNRVLGRDVDAPLELDTATSLGLPEVPAHPGDAALDSVVDSRPDIRNLVLSRKSLEGRARYVKLLYLPSIGATGRIGVTAFDLDQTLEFDQNKEWRYGVGLTWNVFDGGAKLAQARQVESQARQLRLTEQRQRKAARVQIETAYRDYFAADTALAAAEQAVRAARDAQDMLTQDFRAGKGQITDMLAADEDLRQSEFQVLNARYAKVRSRGALRLALGKGIVNEEDK